MYKDIDDVWLFSISIYVNVCLSTFERYPAFTSMRYTAPQSLIEFHVFLVGIKDHFIYAPFLDRSLVNTSDYSNEYGDLQTVHWHWYVYFISLSNYVDNNRLLYNSAKIVRWQSIWILDQFDGPNFKASWSTIFGSLAGLNWIMRKY